MQNCTNLPERAQANWRQIYDLGLYLTNLQHNMENSIFSSENLGGLRYKHKLWAYQFERLERSFNALEKYSEVQEKLQHTQDELTRTNLSQAEHANLRNFLLGPASMEKELGQSSSFLSGSIGNRNGNEA